MTAVSKPIRTPAKPRYHSRLGIVVARELSDHFPKSWAAARLPLIALLIVPAIVFYLGKVDYHGGADSYVRTPYGADHEVRVACAILWGGIATVAAAMLAIAPRIPAVVAWCPFLGYFHPDMAFAARFVLAWTICGCSEFAVSECLSGTRVGSRFQKIWIVYFIVVMAVMLELPGAVYLICLTPVLNALVGIRAAFVQLPLDPRVHSVSSPAVGWNSPHLWPITLIGASIATAFFSWLLVRKLDCGEALSYATPKPYTAFFDRVSRFFEE